MPPCVVCSVLGKSICIGWQWPFRPYQRAAGLFANHALNFPTIPAALLPAMITLASETHSQGAALRVFFAMQIHFHRSCRHPARAERQEQHRSCTLYPMRCCCQGAHPQPSGRWRVVSPLLPVGAAHGCRFEQNPQRLSKASCNAGSRRGPEQRPPSRGRIARANQQARGQSRPRRDVTAARKASSPSG